MLPRDAAPAAIRRLDYRPPAFLVDTVELTFDLAPEATRVSATLAFRRNPGAAAATAMRRWSSTASSSATSRSRWTACRSTGRATCSSEQSLTSSTPPAPGA